MSLSWKSPLLTQCSLASKSPGSWLQRNWESWAWKASLLADLAQKSWRARPPSTKSRCLGQGASLQPSITITDHTAGGQASQWHLRKASSIQLHLLGLEAIIPQHTDTHRHAIHSWHARDFKGSWTICGMGNHKWDLGFPCTRGAQMISWGKWKGIWWCNTMFLWSFVVSYFIYIFMCMYLYKYVPLNIWTYLLQM